MEIWVQTLLFPSQSPEFSLSCFLADVPVKPAFAINIAPSCHLSDRLTPLRLHSLFSESTRNTFPLGASLGLEPRDGQSVMGPCSPLPPRDKGWMELWDLPCSAGSGVRWGPPQPPWVPLPAAPVPLCLGSSCCSWAGSPNPVYRIASVPSSIRLINIRQTPPWGSWHGGGGCTTSQNVGAAAKLPPKKKKKKKEGSIPQPEFCPEPCHPAADLPALKSSPAGTSWLIPGLPSLPQSLFQVHPALITSSTYISAGKLSPPTIISFFCKMGRCSLSGLCVGYVSWPPAVLLASWDTGLCSPCFVGVSK